MRGQPPLKDDATQSHACDTTPRARKTDGTGALRDRSRVQAAQRSRMLAVGKIRVNMAAKTRSLTWR